MSQTLQRQYKASFILDTRGYSEPVESLEDLMKDAITAVGGEVQKMENLGQRDFSRVTEKGHTSDTFYSVHFTGPASAPGDLQDHLRLERRVKRVMVEKAS